MMMIYDIIIRIDKLNSSLSSDEIRDILSRYINENMICNRSKVQIFEDKHL